MRSAAPLGWFQRCEGPAIHGGPPGYSARHRRSAGACRTGSSPSDATLNLRKARDAVPLKAPMQRRAGQVRHRRLQGIEAVVERQQRMAAECRNFRLLGFRQHSGPRFYRPGLHVLDRRPLSPLRNRLGVDAQLPAQLRERSLRSLYCCSDGVRGRGAPVTNLSHSASLHSCERIAPSNRGIKQLHQIKVVDLERQEVAEAVKHRNAPCRDPRQTKLQMITNT